MGDPGNYIRSGHTEADLRAEVESLQAQLAAARDDSERDVALAAAFMRQAAAVRADLSVARAEIKRLRQDKEGQR